MKLKIKEIIIANRIEELKKNVADMLSNIEQLKAMCDQLATEEDEVVKVVRFTARKPFPDIDYSGYWFDDSEEE